MAIKHADRGWPRWLAVAAVAALAAAASGCAAKGKSASGSCAAGERLVAEVCVPEVFFDGDMSPVEPMSIAVDALGNRYVASTLIVVFKGGQTSRDQAVAKLAALGAAVTGAYPGIGLYRVRFDDATTAEALDAKQSALAADAAIAAAMRDVVRDDPPPAARPPADLEQTAVAAGSQWFGFCAPTTASGEAVGSGDTWAYSAINLSAAWDQIYSENPVTAKVVVGIVDTLVDRSVFGGLPFAGAYDLRPEAAKSAHSGYARHGTATASIIGAPNDGKGMNGILSGLDCIRYDLAPQASFWAIDPSAKDDLCGERVNSTLDGFVAATMRALAAGARVVVEEVQWDFRPESSCKNASAADLERCKAGVAALFENMKGVMRVIGAAAPHALFVSAAGNYSQLGAGKRTDAALFWPAAVSIPSAENPADNFITVGALARDGTTPAGYSNGNVSSPGAVNLGAPVGGGDAQTATREAILATLPDGRLTLFDGTSAATPMVAGVAGLVFAIAPMLKGREVKALLLDSADSAEVDAFVGGKRVNAQRAVDAALEVVFQRDPNRLGEGTCKPKQTPPPVAQGNACKLGGGSNAIFDDYCAGPQTGSAWLASTELQWWSPTVLWKLSLRGTNPTTGAALTLDGLVFTSVGGAAPTNPAGLSVSADKITGTVSAKDLDPDNEGPLGRYTPPGGSATPITSVDLALTFSGLSVAGTIDVHTAASSAQIELKAVSACPKGFKNGAGEQLCNCSCP
ncbi:MAG: S8 family serine peptidase [Proteobacteria bacterium]|nr:S8 family serine peptidase [Pseudomonadota bacterium]